MTSASTDQTFSPGELTQLTPRISRLVAPNAGPMTGPGTNTYLIKGAGPNDPVTVVDPGPALEAHVVAIMNALDGRQLQAVLVTHTHRDHSPAASVLHERLGMARWGRVSHYAQFQDQTFVPDHPVDESTVVVGNGYRLRAVLTPGHASNHVCWYLEEERALFTGDHILGTVSPVILPPDGDMRDYLLSMDRLKAMPLEHLFPGHGPVLTQPARVIEGLIRHRLAREAKIVRTLRSMDDVTIAELVIVVYADVSADLHQWASYSLHAHLLKLSHEGIVEERHSRWRLLQPEILGSQV